MLKSEEILNEIESMKSEVKTLQAENKVDDALLKIEEINNKKKELELAKQVEDMDKKEIENKIEIGDVKDMDKEKLINGLSKEKVDFLNAVRTGQFSNIFSQADQGAVIPKTVSTDIIDVVKERLDIVGSSTKFNIKGEIAFPVYGVDETNTGISASYADDFSAITATNGKFTSVSLKGHLVGCLAKIGKKLIANTDVAVYNFVVSKVAEAITDFLEEEMTIGSTKIKGYETTTNTKQMEGTSISSNDLISLQMAIKNVFQTNAKWRMNTTTFESLRKLKDSNGQYLLNKDIVNGFGMTLLGKPVEIEENATTICYGDFSGYYTNVVENMEVQILLEKYAEEHAIGVIAWVEADGAPIDIQNYIKLIPKAI